MSIYQRCLSKSLIFFSFCFVIFLLFIESNVGFKYIFNFTSCFFTGFKVEEISGNWRDFTLKNIKYDISGISMTANSIHVILDTRSLFKKPTIFKEIETKNLIISLKSNGSSRLSENNISLNTLKKDIFIKYSLIFKKIHADKIFFKSYKANIFFFNILSSVQLNNNNIIISPTYIDDIHLSFSTVDFKKKHILNKLNFIQKSNYPKKIYNFLQIFLKNNKKFVASNINLISLRCNRIKFVDYKNDNLFQLQLKAKIKHSILKIKKIKIDSSFLKINSHGKIIFNNDYSISCLIKNSIMIPRFYNRIINILFESNFNVHKKFIFRLESQDLYKIKIYGSVLLNSLYYPFFIKLKSQNLAWSIKKNYVLKLNSSTGILKGKINNYFLSLKNIITLQNLPSIFMSIKGKGNLQNIFLKKIKFFRIKKTKFCKKTINLKDNIEYNQYILKLMGKMNIVGKSNNNTYSLCIPKINLDGNIMKKKLSILGSIYYKKLNYIETTGINFFLGNNKVFLKGLLGKKYKVYSAIYADNLDYFLPSLKGKIKAKINVWGDDMFSHITSKILASNLNWNNILFKSIKILTKMNINHVFLGKTLIDAKKIHVYNFNIDTLHIQTHCNNNKQKFSLLLKSNALYINLIINGFFNKKTGDWHGFFDKINIKTFWGQLTAKKNNLIDYYDSNNNVNFFKQNNIKIRDSFLSFLYDLKMSFFNMFNQSLISFKSKVSVNAKFKWILGEKISDGKIFLTGKNIILEKNIKKRIFIENIDYFNISTNLVKDNFKSKWIVKKTKNSLKNKSIVGYLNIIDIYHKKKIKGRFTIYNFPFSFINSFSTNFKKVNGMFQSKIKLFGTLYQPQISADISFKNIFIRSKNILKYITLFFPYFSGKIDFIRINQEIIMKKGNLLFKLNPFLKNSNNIEWNLIFNSKNILVSIFPKIKVQFSSQLNLHYLLSKYDLVGYIKFFWFCFKINEKDFIF
ncbi:conserved protein [Buchnera aphidicola str. Ak (Acyrthosiphon kondoi)]|uniref:Conserved protein n=1 Tax=Buchnera aphidicola str. Ak (Acyrthosiphon kondoi) TaxID=1005090 RepID=G2LMG3_9GAMM|nr:hypothetical protein [Buchnera aphidicola]AEO08451.1 conserved protein [Buchnera aphidicola str. Ak (Acyrthosiphon kondoi)]